MNAQTNTTAEDQHESIYALLIHSEERSRNALEAAIYPLLILGAVIAIWQFAQQPVNIPPLDSKATVCVVRGRPSLAARNWITREIRG